MPDTDGIEMITKLLEDFPEAKIIAMTGATGDMNFLDVAKQCGVRHVFEKPFDLDSLVSAIHEELAHELSSVSARAPVSRPLKKGASFFGMI